jgi:hypothetical protein
VFASARVKENSKISRKNIEIPETFFNNLPQQQPQRQPCSLWFVNVILFT